MMDLGEELDHANRVRSIVAGMQWFCVIIAVIGLFGCVIVGGASHSKEGGAAMGAWAGAVLGIAQAACWAILWVLLSILRLIAVQTQHTLQSDLQRQQAALRQRQTPSEFGPRPPPTP